MRLKTSNKIFFTLVLSLAFSCPVFADANSISISCPATAPVGSPTVCTISGHSSGAISGISTAISANNLNILKIAIDPSWYGDANDGQIVVTTDTNKQGNFTIGTISVQPETVGSTGNINLSNVVFSNNSFIEFSVSGTSASLSAVESINPKDEKKEGEGEENSDAASLENLEISGYDLDFSSDKYTYSLNIPEEVSTLNIIATPKNETSVVTISGNENLADGSVIKITVENGEAKSIYRIKISNTKVLATTTDDSNSGSALAIAIICSIAIIITGIFAIFLFRKKKSQKTSPSKTKPSIPALPRKNLTSFMKPVKTTPKPAQSPQSVPIPQSTPKPTEPEIPKENPVEVKSPTVNTNPFMTGTSSFNPFEEIEKPTQPISEKPIQKEPTPTPTPAPIKPAPKPVEVPKIPKDNRPISLDEIPFEQSPSGPQLKKPTTPIIFES